MDNSTLLNEQYLILIVNLFWIDHFCENFCFKIFLEPEEPDIRILEPDIGMNIDNIPSEFSQISDNNEVVHQSDNQSNQVLWIQNNFLIL